MQSCAAISWFDRPSSSIVKVWDSRVVRTSSIAAGGRCEASADNRRSKMAETRGEQHPRNTTSLSVSATPTYMDRQSQLWIGLGLVQLVFTFGIPDGAGQGRRFGAGADAELGQQAMHVILDCMNRDAELRCDILVRQTQFQHPQDLGLARRKNWFLHRRWPLRSECRNRRSKMAETGGEQNASPAAPWPFRTRKSSSASVRV